MRIVRHSRILRAAEEAAGRVRNAFAKSRILQALGGVYMRIEQAFRGGRLAFLSDAETDRGAWQYRFRRAWLRAVEESRIMRLLSSLSTALLETSIGSYGCFFVLYGSFAAAIRLVGVETFRGSVSLYAALILCVASVPLLLSNRSLSYGIRHSVVLSWFLIGFCGIGEERFGLRDRGREHLWWALLLAFCASMGTTYLSVARTAALIFLLLALWLLLEVPELCLTTFLLSLPFLAWSRHATAAATVGALLCLITWLAKALRGRRVLRFGAIDLSVLLFALAFLIGGAVSRGGTASVIKGVSAFCLISVWFPVRGLFSDRKWRARGIAAIKLGAAVTSVWGIGEYFLTDLTLNWVDVSRFSDIGGRVCAGFGNPNVLAVYLLCTVPLFLGGAADESRTHTSRVCNLIGFIAGVGCLILTWSRGAWLGIAVATLLFLLSFSRRSAGCVALSLLPLGCLSPYLPHSIVNRFVSIGSFSESSIRYRFYTWRGVLRMLREHAWGIGVGSEAFYAVYPRYAVSGTERVMHAHQLWLQILVELGIGGLIVFLWLLLLLFFCVAQGMRDLHGGARAQTVAGASALAGVLVMGFFDYVWYHMGLISLFLAVGALTTLPISECEEGVE